MSICLFNGSPIFGVANRASPRPDPADVQLDSYPGVPGRIALALGSRGGTWPVSGVILAADLPTLYSLQASLNGLVANATSGTFTDSGGNDWPYCYLEGPIQWHAEGPLLADSVWCLPFTGLIVRTLQ